MVLDENIPTSQYGFVGIGRNNSSSSNNATFGSVFASSGLIDARFRRQVLHRAAAPKPRAGSSNRSDQDLILHHDHSMYPISRSYFQPVHATGNSCDIHFRSIASEHLFFANYSAAHVDQPHFCTCDPAIKLNGENVVDRIREDGNTDRML